MVVFASVLLRCQFFYGILNGKTSVVSKRGTCSYYNFTPKSAVTLRQRNVEIRTSTSVSEISVWAVCTAVTNATPAVQRGH